MCFHLQSSRFSFGFIFAVRIDCIREIRVYSMRLAIFFKESMDFGGLLV